MRKLVLIAVLAFLVSGTLAQPPMPGQDSGEEDDKEAPPMPEDQQQEDNSSSSGESTEQKEKKASEDDTKGKESEPASLLDGIAKIIDLLFG